MVVRILRYDHQIFFVDLLHMEVWNDKPRKRKADIDEVQANLFIDFERMQRFHLKMPSDLVLLQFPKEFVEKIIVYTVYRPNADFQMFLFIFEVFQFMVKLQPFSGDGEKAHPCGCELRAFCTLTADDKVCSKSLLQLFEPMTYCGLRHVHRSSRFADILHDGYRYKGID